MGIVCSCLRGTKIKPASCGKQYESPIITGMGDAEIAIDTETRPPNYNYIQSPTNSDDSLNRARSKSKECIVRRCFTSTSDTIYKIPPTNSNSSHLYYRDT